jgi:hypothetical protein
VNHPYIPLYVGDWLKDPKLSLCSPATRGIWIDIICRLHELDQGGQITANAQQFARLCRCSDVDIHTAIIELQTTNAAEVYERNGIFTVICRRMKRAAELSEKRKQAGSKSAAKREQNPEYDGEDESRGLERVREFARGEGIGQGDADWFFWKGRGNGWTNAGKPMLDWKATLRSWKRGGYLPSQRQQRLNSPTVTKYGLALPKGCTIRDYDNAVLDSSGRVMDINQVRKAAKSQAT